MEEGIGQGAEFRDQEKQPTQNVIPAKAGIQTDSKPEKMYALFLLVQL